MSHLRHWKLNCSPFGGSSTTPFFFDGGSVDEAIARIGFLVQNERQLGIVAGPNGVGKTLLLRNLRSHLARSNVKQSPLIAYVSLMGIQSGELPSRISANIQGQGGYVTNSSTESRWRELQDVMIGSAVLKQRLVILLDDFDCVSSNILEDVHRLFQLSAPLTCVASVSDEGVMALSRHMLDRCELRIDLPPWSLGQTADYFDFCLGRARASDDLFDAQSITRIQELSDGIPRRINQIGELCLVAGAIRQAERITSSLVEIAVEELPVRFDFDYPGEAAAA